MTEQQKEKILALKSEGFTNKAIGEQLGLNPEAVKTFIRRQRNKQTVKAKKKPDGPVCLECVKPFVLGRYSNQKFCSVKCRQKWWTKHQGGNKDYVCAHCGKEFKAYAKRKYCSHECYIADRFSK